MQDNLQSLADGQEFTGVSVHSGFPNPAADNLSRGSGLALDLNQLLIKHPSSTYLFRINGQQWTDQGIFDGDIAIIDRALAPHPQDIVLIWQDDVFELHRYGTITKNQHIWGVAQAIIHPRNQA